METSRYRALLKSVELGSFSKAAQELAYTPSGVSQLISALEKDLRFSCVRAHAQRSSLN